MGCNCKEMKGFDLTMFKARAYEQKNKKQAAVFVINEKTVSFTDLSNIEKVSGICCYFTTDGVEHEIKVSKKTKEIEVVEETSKEETVLIAPKKKRSKKD